MQHANEDFKGLRALLWPIHNYELKKFIPTAIIMFCILFNYTVMRDTKDAFVVNSIGAASIPFLKLLITPCAILFVLIYAELVSKFSHEKVFYLIITPFLIFFGFFGFVLYPMVDIIHMSPETVKSLYAYSSMKWVHQLIDIMAHWSYSLFYILSEIWGSAMIALMFWQYANRITRRTEAKRFYGLFQTFGNAALMLSGPTVAFCSMPANFAWGTSVKLLCASIVVMGIIAMLVFRWMHTTVLTDKKYYDPSETQQKKEKKKKPSLMDSMRIVFHSKELGYIAILMISYGITVNIVELQWKDQMKIYFQGNLGAYNAFMGWQSFYIGLVTVVFSWFIGTNILRRAPWRVAALITPVLLLSLGGIFFGCIVSQDFMASLLKGFIESPVAGAVFVGLATVVISKSIKYALFDPTKDLAYMTLDETAQTTGKAAVDVIGGRAGKAGGALVQATFLIICGTKVLADIAPYTGVVFLIICVAWIWAVVGLSRRINPAHIPHK
ncbi:MAG: NTP/NDP exchange transporter [Alphaproteobacteria bacterium]|nr:MAG: NTP/NDP exchange transporter [Alphaproteobacteria bacterium]